MFPQLGMLLIICGDHLVSGDGLKFLKNLISKFKGLLGIWIRILDQFQIGLLIIWMYQV